MNYTMPGFQYGSSIDGMYRHALRIGTLKAATRNPPIFKTITSISDSQFIDFLVAISAFDSDYKKFADHAFNGWHTNAMRYRETCIERWQYIAIKDYSIVYCDNDWKLKVLNIFKTL